MNCKKKKGKEHELELSTMSLCLPDRSQQKRNIRLGKMQHTREVELKVREIDFERRRRELISSGVIHVEKLSRIRAFEWHV